MTEQEKTHELAMQVDIDNGTHRGWSGSHIYRHIYGRLCFVPKAESYGLDGKQLLYGSDYYHVKGITYEDREWINHLQVNSQGEIENGKFSGLYATEVRMRDVYSADATELERMAKCLRKVTRSLEKQRQSDGSHQGYGQFMLRVCKAFGIKKMIFKANDNCASGYEYIIRTLYEGQQSIEYKIREWEHEAQEAVNV